MKTHRKYFFTTVFIVCTAQLGLIAQVKEIPVTTSSKEALSLFEKGRDKFDNQEIPAAASLFDQAIQKDTDFALAYLYRARTGGGFNVYRQNLDKAVSLEAKVSDGEKLLISYAQAFDNGNGQKLEANLDQLLKSFPEDKRVHELAGNQYFIANDFQKALDQFTKSAELDKNYAPIYNMLGYCQSALNNYPEAEKAFQTYIKLIPDSPNPYDSYAELLLKTGKYDESIDQYKKALEKDPSFAPSLAGIGNNYVFKGDYNSARKYYQEYYDKSPAVGGKLDALYMKAVSFVHEGKTDDAVKTFDDSRALAEKENITPSIYNSYNNQGFILTESGKPAEGKKCFDKAENLIESSKLPEVDKENLRVHSMLWNFYFLTANNELDKAGEAADKCKAKVDSRKNADEEMQLNSLLGMYELKKGEYDKAIKSFAQGDSQDPLTWYYTAQAYAKENDKQNSVKLYGKITKWNVNSMNLAFVRQNAMEEVNGNISADKSK
jgi:tetratricopeptide (TPR) repeat protein